MAEQKPITEDIVRETLAGTVATKRATARRAAETANGRIEAMAYDVVSLEYADVP